jgi:hypothetical protein
VTVPVVSGAEVVDVPSKESEASPDDEHAETATANTTVRARMRGVGIGRWYGQIPYTPTIERCP